MKGSGSLRIVVDADACPVKEEVYRVAERYDLSVILVADAPLALPRGVRATMVVVDRGPDAADDWIAENVLEGDVVVTADIPLAARCLDARARVLGMDGRPFSEDSIGDALASRALNAHLREIGVGSGGPRALAQKDRSRFLSRLDQLVQSGLRALDPTRG